MTAESKWHDVELPFPDGRQTYLPVDREQVIAAAFRIEGGRFSTTPSLGEQYKIDGLEESIVDSCPWAEWSVRRRDIEHRLVGGVKKDRFSRISLVLGESEQILRMIYDVPIRNKPKGFSAYQRKPAISVKDQSGSELDIGARELTSCEVVGRSLVFRGGKLNIDESDEGEDIDSYADQFTLRFFKENGVYRYEYTLDESR